MLTVLQPRQVLSLLLSAKILFAGKVYEWDARISYVPADSCIYLRYDAYSKHLHGLSITKDSSLMSFKYERTLSQFKSLIASCKNTLFTDLYEALTSIGRYQRAFSHYDC